MRTPFLCSSLFSVLTLAYPASVAAQDAATPAADPAPVATTVPVVPAAPEVATAPVATVPAASAPVPVSFGWEALVDVYYLYNFTGEPSTQAPGLRVFDTTANNLALNYAKLGMHAETALVGVRLDVGVGHAAAIINRLSRETSAPNTPDTPNDTDELYGDGVLVQQAFATVKPTSYLSIDAGRLMTMASFELFEANKNWLYSHSLLFYGLPALHTGVRVHATLTPTLSLAAELCNGWNNDPDNNAGKTLGANATYANAESGFTAAVTSYLGKEGGGDGNDLRVLVDALVSKQLGRLSLAANADFVNHGDARWFGVAGMGRVVLADWFNLAFRGEYLKTKQGGFFPLLMDASLYEVTVQGALTVGGHYELRGELRADLSDQAVFAKGTTPRKNQVTGLLAALAYF